ncbi:MAG: phage-related protein [Dasania sp.]|jgi:phage-related protein
MTDIKNRTKEFFRDLIDAPVDREKYRKVVKVLKDNQTVTDTFGNAIMPPKAMARMAEDFDEIKNSIKNLNLDGISNYTKTITGTVKNSFSDLGNTVTNGLDTATKHRDTLTKTLTGTIENSFNDLGNTVTSGLNTATKHRNTLAETLTGTVKNSFNDLGNTVTNGLNTATKHRNTLAETITDTVKNSFNDLGNTVTSGLNTATKHRDTLAETLTGTVKNSFSDLGNTVTNGLNTATKHRDTLTKTLTGTIENGLAATGKLVTDTGEKLVNLVNTNSDENTQKVLDALEGSQQPKESFYGDVKSLITTQYDKFSNYVGDPKTANYIAGGLAATVAIGGLYYMSSSSNAGKADEKSQKTED